MINTIFFGLTTWKIIELKTELKNIMSEKESARKMKNQQDGYIIRFSFFLGIPNILSYFTFLIQGTQFFSAFSL